MDGLKQEIGTITVVDDETIEDRYKRCGLLNVIQHIDIYGKFRSSYVEQTKSRVQAGNDTPLAITSISASSGRFSNLSDAYSDVTRPKSVSTKLSKFSVTTRVSGLYPGHDILSRRARKCRLSDKKNNVCFGAYVSR